MTTRSRKGCIDCKQAKVKCDEVHPACGTCARRNRSCRGYLDGGSKVKSGLAGRSAHRSSSMRHAPYMSCARQPRAMLPEHSDPLESIPPIDGTAFCQGPMLPMPDMSLHDMQTLAMSTTMLPFAMATPLSSPDSADMAWVPVNWSEKMSDDSIVYISDTPALFPDLDPDLDDIAPSNSSTVAHPDNRRLLGPVAAARSHSPVLDVSGLWSPSGVPSPDRGPSFLPLHDVVAQDKLLIEMYFVRHPAEMVIGSQFFINEMNGAVLSLLQVSPAAVGESLCAIGENYAGGSHRVKHGDSSLESADAASATTATPRKTRLLRRLQLLNKENDDNSPEVVLLLLLLLCGAELTSPHSDGKGGSLPELIDRVAAVVAHHTRAGHALSTTSKYFARGVARQDLLHALSRMRRPKIHPASWLDDYGTRHADRLLGLTATLTPMLYRLAELAGDVQAVWGVGAANSVSLAQHDSLAPLAERAGALRAELLTWRPIHDQALSLQTSRALLLHASAWRAAALLYLFRLFHRPGHNDNDNDNSNSTALGMAYEVMMHIHGPADDVKLSLWPLFVAACELVQPDDRALASALFDDVCRARPTTTARRTRDFVTEHIWRARDRGDAWDWMQLAQSSSHEFMPL